MADEKEVPQTETPATETQVTETPVTEVPAAEALVTEATTSETQTEEAPAVETKAEETIKTTNPQLAKLMEQQAKQAQQAQQAKQAKQVQQTQQKPAVQQTGMSFEDRIAELKVSGTQNQKTVINELEQYIARMKPGMPVDGDKGAKAQYGLWHTLRKILETMPQEEFKNLWMLVMLYFHQHREGVFHERYVFRFSEFWNWSEKDLTAFQRILNLLKLTANPATRNAALKQVNLERSLADGISEEARQRLVTLYRS